MTAPGRTSAPLVFCIVLNWNGASDTIACIHSLLAQDYPALRILLVDNASDPADLARIRSDLPGVEVLTAPANRGFATGNNIGILSALERHAEFIWLLNNDTIAPSSTLTQLVAAARHDPYAGLIGTVLYYLHNPTQVQAWGGGAIARSSGFSSHFKSPHRFGDTSYLTFASVLIRRQVFEAIGLLDEQFFMYFEDADFCFRARTAGWKLAIAPDTAVLHREGGSAPRRDTRAAVRTFTASGLRFLSRHGRPRSLAPRIFLALRLANRLVRADLSAAAAVLEGARDWRSCDPEDPPR